MAKSAATINENGTHSAWVQDVITEWGHEVLVANPRLMEGSKLVAAQDSRPSGSLLLSCKALSSSTSCRLFRKHLPADCVGGGGLGTQPNLHRETETP